MLKQNQLFCAVLHFFFLNQWHLSYTAVINKTIEPITEKCLTCICYGATDCGVYIKCDDDVCGLFALTYYYWENAGRPTLELDSPDAAGAYMRCTNDYECSKRTVMDHMKNFPYDCNKDGIVNCIDYAKIHNKGKSICEGPLDIDFEERYNRCMTSDNYTFPKYPDYIDF